MSNKTKQIKAQPGVKVQPIVLALIHIVVAVVLGWWLPLPLAVPPLLRALGFLLVVLGFFIGLAALRAFRAGRTISGARLVTSGVYRLSRNPVYLGFLFMLIGIPLNAGSYWGILLAPVLVLLFNRFVIEPEEHVLKQRFGNEYEKYRARVRRWI